MNKKISSVITGIKLNRATFANVSIENLTFINFFYGNNGVGKSTIASAISENDGIEWMEGTPKSNYDVLVYNQEFINRNFSDYNNLPGVFTVHEENIKLQQEINEKKEKKKQINFDIEKATDVLKQKQNIICTLIKSFQNDCWTKTTAVRTDFECALDGKKQKKKFAYAILDEPNPQNHSLNDLKQLYNAAFNNFSKTYNKFSRVDKTPSYGKLPGKDLLDKMILSRSDTTFARFIKALNASDWVRFGHTHYNDNTEGKCPYCQQELPEFFEEKISECFDAQYQKDIYDLQQFQSTYAKETKEIIECLKKNLIDTMETIDLTEYKSRIVMLERLFEINNHRLSEKISQPGKMVSLENTDSILLGIGNLIDDINRQIDINNETVLKKRTAKSNCKKFVNEYLAFILESDVKCYNDKLENVQKELDDIELKIKQLKKELSEIDLEISKLISRTVNTESAVNSINKILKNSGFQGFRLKSKEGVQNTYEIVRDNQDKEFTVKNLSEGEKNFIAFLYFYHMVLGSMEQNQSKEKIVVIDDPVSGMDGNTVFIVSSIVREMIDLCKNNTKYKSEEVLGNYIKQLFVLTHNINFYQEITYQQTQYYSCASFYLIKKVDNISTVRLCDRQRIQGSNERENYSPVQNSYEALWNELRDIQSTTQAKNVMRRIIQHYFFRLCGYNSFDLRNLILKKLSLQLDFEQVNARDYKLISSLLGYVDINGVNYVEEYDDIESCKRAFELVFDLMNHKQHYNLMIGSVKSL